MTYLKKKKKKKECPRNNPHGLWYISSSSSEKGSILYLGQIFSLPFTNELGMSCSGPIQQG